MSINAGESLDYRKSILIVQPYVPTYRKAFFSQLIEQLAMRGIRCRIAAASPQPGQLERGDAVEADWIISYSPRQLRVMDKTIGLGGARRLWAQEDGVIVGHLGSSLDSCRAILDAKRNRLRVGLWGHIKSYVNDGNPLDLAIENWQLRNSDHVFAYTPGGRDHAISKGVDEWRVTTVMNATDTSSLVLARDLVSTQEVGSFMEAHNLKTGRTLGYIGGLDSSKRIDFLAATLDRLWLSDPDIRVVIGGRGSDAHLLDAARSRGQVAMLGYVSADEQALIARAASALVMPGRIGLVAVDALVLGIPILTTDWPYHAPEYEYLADSKSRFTSSDDVESYASLIRRFLSYEIDSQGSLGPGLWSFPTIDAMVENFQSGILRMLAPEED
ncbi:glycosyltransferase [Pseudarthrobacter raffinosi]|uniref:glycosyltransferase n=1 Tax=Pseudarthrobacter raffinosi TaxID=2953651 RepID=UPI00208E7DB3|nr:glycosyltransferase [Pseudarthrobacter sp. MDT3-9]MCO4253144.1 glycosyltransferase [Pseudarthrobacter sp. MDT3-9]